MVLPWLSGFQRGGAYCNGFVHKHLAQQIAWPFPADWKSPRGLPKKIKKNQKTC
jgi:hypothetical protein